MLRIRPTRIDLKHEDIVEFDKLKSKTSSNKQEFEQSSKNKTDNNIQVARKEIRDRIGYAA